MEPGPVIRGTIDTDIRSILIMGAHDTHAASGVKHDRLKPSVTLIYFSLKKPDFLILGISRGTYWSRRIKNLDVRLNDDKCGLMLRYQAGLNADRRTF